ncbi:MAG: hypothetical protein LJE96_02475 [Deltaproteobacteria bacterium]|nr:hypothetical protein [Deltaproteobacteria bacterium]
MTIGIDYSQWKLEHESILNDFSRKEIFFLFSAGKDSSLAMHFMVKAADEFGFAFQAHSGAFPVHRYDAKEKNRISSYWERRGIRPEWHESRETDVILDAKEKPCLTCQSIRKKMLHDFMSENVKDWKNLVIVTSYSLWDLVSYAMEQTLTNFMGEISEAQRKANKRRKLETMQRFHTFLKMNDGYAVFRPLVRYNGIDIEYEVKKNDIPTLATPCRFGDQRPKRVLENYYKQLGTGFDYNQLLEHTRQCLSFPDASTWTGMGRKEYLGNYF